MTSPYDAVKAVRARRPLRMVIHGKSGSGKSLTAMKIASALGRFVVLDTEQKSACIYAGGAHGLPEFDFVAMENCKAESYMAAIDHQAGKYDVLIIDSLSPSWQGEDGLLQRVDDFAAKSDSQNKFNAWGKVTPILAQLLKRITSWPGHVICTLREKTKYEIVKDSRGKNVPQKIGVEPIMRDGFEYEFDVIGRMTEDHELVIAESRYTFSGATVFPFPGPEVGTMILEICNGTAKESTPVPVRATIPGDGGGPKSDSPVPPVAGPVGDNGGAVAAPAALAPQERHMESMTPEQLKAARLEAFELMKQLAGKDVAIGILKERGYAKLSEVPMDQFPVLLEYCRDVGTEVPFEAPKPAPSPPPTPVPAPEVSPPQVDAPPLAAAPAPVAGAGDTPAKQFAKKEVDTTCVRMMISICGEEDTAAILKEEGIDPNDIPVTKFRDLTMKAQARFTAREKAKASPPPASAPVVDEKEEKMKVATECRALLRKLGWTDPGFVVKTLQEKGVVLPDKWKSLLDLSLGKMNEILSVLQDEAEGAI